MFTVICIMLGGILIGYLLRNKRLTFLNKTITVLIWVLLLLLGIEVGGNRQIVEGISSLGIEAVVISVLSTLGSCVASWVLWRIVSKQKKGGEE